MSHAVERKEKNCLNCNAQVQGRFCQACGQENIETKESFWHLTTHFVYDIMHFDGKFFSTVKYLLLRPGFLSQEHLKGRRASYLHPIRMYVFVSAFFFIYLFSSSKHSDFLQVEKDPSDTVHLTAKQTIQALQENKRSIEQSMADKNMPEVAKEPLRSALQNVNDKIAKLQKDSTQKIDDDDGINIDNGDFHYKTIEQYDSAQKALPPASRDGWFKRIAQHRNIEMKEEYGNDKKEIIEHFVEKFKHSMPELMFVSLPLFALVLQLLYVRHKAQFYYVDHVIFSVHLYCAVFILTFLGMVLSSVSKIPYLHWFRFIELAAWLYLAWYTLKAIKNFYQQGWAKTIFKWIVLNISAIVLMFVLFILYVMFIALTF